MGWFSGALPAATTSITGNRELIRQPGFPTAILPAVPILSGLVHFLIAMSLVLVAVVLAGRTVSITGLALPLVMAVQFLVTLSVSYLTATARSGSETPGISSVSRCSWASFSRPSSIGPARFPRGIRRSTS
jgi:ABC-type polysaccharide/polyol phosphate export permease